MNIKSVTLNHSSLVLGGPRLHSYCLLWFIRRCMWLFDVLSREVSHLLEKWGGKRFETRHGFAKMAATDGFVVFWCMYVWGRVHLLCKEHCRDVLTHWIACTIKWPFVGKLLFFSSRCWQSILMLGSGASCILYLTYALKIWLEEKGFPQRIWGLITYQRNYFFLFILLPIWTHA